MHSHGAAYQMNYRSIVKQMSLKWNDTDREGFGPYPQREMNLLSGDAI